MRLLLDAHTLLWATGDSSKLRETARTAINDPDNDVLVSIPTGSHLSFVSATRLRFTLERVHRDWNRG